MHAWITLPLWLELLFSSWSASPSPTTTSVSTDPTSASSLPKYISLTSGSSAPSTQLQSFTPVSPTSFSPFPVPSDIHRFSIYQAIDPSRPLSVDSSDLPDFGPAWAAAHAKARAKIAGLTLDEKISIVTGVGWTTGRCLGNISPIIPTQGRGWTGLCLNGSPLGVSSVDFVTAFPAGINAAASFNRGIIRSRGLFIGQEHRGKGVNIAFGPMMNMGRVPQGGRNWEGFGADPFLAGEVAYETILGMQQGGVMACAKHLIGNEQEHIRMQSSSDIDDRTLHEIYAHPFLKSIMAGVGSMMCSYNLLNGTYACENDKLMNDIIKREFGFQGFIMSDFFARQSTMSAVTGLDMSMPGVIVPGLNSSFFGSNLTAYVNDGIIPESRVNDMASRILAAWYLLGQDSPAFPPTNFNEVGCSKYCIVKNEHGALPLGKKDRTITLIGSGAGPGRTGPNQFAFQLGIDGVLAVGWGSGTADFTYIVTPLDAIQSKARKFHTSITYLLDDFDLLQAGNMAIKPSAALVFLASDSGEDLNIDIDGNKGDRNNLTAWHGGDNLVLTVAAQNNNTIVVINSVGPLILESWIEHPNVSAVIWAGMLGQEVGNALADILYGTWNPSGRLPYTIAKRPVDYPAQLITGEGLGPDDILSIPYTERLNIDYRHFDAKNITPRFEFGFGLSYTTFTYSDLSVQAISTGDVSALDAALISAWEKSEATPIAKGSSQALWLHRPAFDVSFTIKNSGSVFGEEIPQVYVHFPASAGEPPSVLKGFTNAEISPGNKKTVSITLSRYDLSIWDVVGQGWRKPQGQIGISVGASSRDLRLNGYLFI